jgi:hypothetical protein
VRALVHAAGDGDAGLAEDMGDLRVAEARSIVFEREMVLLFIDAKATQAIGIGEGAEAAELFEAQRRLEFVGDLEQCHGLDYNRGRTPDRDGSFAPSSGARTEGTEDLTQDRG